MTDRFTPTPEEIAAHPWHQSLKGAQTSNGEYGVKQAILGLNDIDLTDYLFLRHAGKLNIALPQIDRTLKYGSLSPETLLAEIAVNDDNFAIKMVGFNADILDRLHRKIVSGERLSVDEQAAIWGIATLSVSFSTPVKELYSDSEDKKPNPSFSHLKEELDKLADDYPQDLEFPSVYTMLINITAGMAQEGDDFSKWERRFYHPDGGEGQMLWRWGFVAMTQIDLTRALEAVPTFIKRVRENDFDPETNLRDLVHAGNNASSSSRIDWLEEVLQSSLAEGEQLPARISEIIAGFKSRALEQTV